MDGPDAITTSRVRASAAFAIPGLCAAAALLLWTTAAARPDDPDGRQFFGLWRTRHVLLALALVWVAVAWCCAACSRRALGRLLLLQGSLALVWLGLELAGLLGAVSWPQVFASRSAEQHGQAAIPHLDASGTAREDLAVLWHLLSPPIPYRFRTDRRGFRNEPDRERADVYCLGDSFLVAGLVPFPEVLSAQLERRLGRPVMNVALVGLSPQEERRLLSGAHVPLAGSLVLHFVFEGNDLLDSARWRQAEAHVADTTPWSQRTLANCLVDQLQILTQPQPSFVPRRTGFIGETPYHFQWLANSFAGLDGELEPILDSLSALRREVEQAGGRYAVVLIPTTLRVLGPHCRFPEDSAIADWRTQCGPLPAALRAWSVREGVPFLDLTEALDAAARGGEVPWFPADTHWNTIGHRVAAEALAAWPAVRAWSNDHPAQ